MIDLETLSIIFVLFCVLAAILLITLNVRGNTFEDLYDKVDKMEPHGIVYDKLLRLEKFSRESLLLFFYPVFSDDKIIRKSVELKKRLDRRMLLKNEKQSEKDSRFSEKLTELSIEIKKDQK